MNDRAGIYERLTALPYIHAYRQLIMGAVELDVFTQLETPVTAGELSGRMSWNEYNTLNLLKGLYGIGFLERDGDSFRNMPETSRYLVRGKPEYMGGVLSFFCGNQGMNLGNVARHVKEGPKPEEHTQRSMDFAAYGAAMRDAQSGIRQQELLDIIHSLPENSSIGRILDLGCGAGCLGLAVIQDAPKRTGVLFDLPSMKGLIEETVSLAGMQERASVMTGDFTKDDIGGGYDLILCHSIMLFAIAGGPDFFARLRMALNPGGLVVCVNEGIEPDYSGPWDMILGYMAFNLQGMPIGVLKGQVADMAKAAGFGPVENRTALLSTGTHDINILRKRD